VTVGIARKIQMSKYIVYHTSASRPFFYDDTPIEIHKNFTFKNDNLRSLQSQSPSHGLYIEQRIKVAITHARGKGNQ